MCCLGSRPVDGSSLMFTEHGQAIRLISARKATRRERRALCANDSETLTPPGITVEGGEVNRPWRGRR